MDLINGILASVSLVLAFFLGYQMGGHHAYKDVIATFERVRKGKNDGTHNLP